MPRKRINKKSTLNGTTTSNKPILLIGLGAVLVVVVLIYFALSGTSAPANTPTASQPGIPYPEINRVPLLDAKKAYDNQSALFLDVRSESSYETSHIQGAKNIPADKLEESLNQLDPNQWIITYCT
jgi:hypothetical protein